MKRLRVISVCVIWVLTTSCVSYLPQVEPSYALDQNKAILYGRFKFIDNVTNESQSRWGYNMVLRLFNEYTRKMLYLHFSKSDPVLCVSVPSGRYRIVGYGVTDGFDKFDLVGTFRGNEKFTPSFNSKRDSAIYLGDFSGYANAKVMFTIMELKAGIVGNPYNYIETTKAFHQKYPNLAAMPVSSAFDLTGTNKVVPAPNPVLDH